MLPEQIQQHGLMGSLFGALKGWPTQTPGAGQPQPVLPPAPNANVAGTGGRLAGGQHFSRGTLYLMLQNRLYRGDIVHQSEAYPGQHEAILDPELWQIVQNKLAVHRQERALAVGAEAPSLLAGLIVDADGSRMTPTHATKPTPPLASPTMRQT